MAAIFQRTFSNAFFLMKTHEFQLRFHLFIRMQLYIPALVKIMVWRLPGDKPLSEPMIVSLLTHIGLKFIRSNDNADPDCTTLLLAIHLLGVEAVKQTSAADLRPCLTCRPGPKFVWGH